MSVTIVSSYKICNACSMKKIIHVSSENGIKSYRLVYNENGNQRDIISGNASNDRRCFFSHVSGHLDDLPCSVVGVKKKLKSR